MAQIIFLCFLLVNAFTGPAMASDEFHANAPSPGPSYSSQPPRKLGKHSSIAPQAAKTVHSTAEESRSLDKIGTAPSDLINGENVSLEGQVIHLRGHHHSIDKSVAGGGVIIGSLATTFLVAIFCYIRATRRHKAETEITN
ncbi:uncharacterized protein LOC8259338 [Ricinus communis]|uniref:Uncharacterized protein n=1 Tax=Ricinus communis TaxID=3988 RepID=B9T882_RICCO|nr:uncharacterized protein LOC8259338 [Ricinus communis]EEF27931.1 conserved hypothetical protein [Ricinus communis]|eukprot:XP_002534451.3 uncharacterized protein LOC8259338 [Ricinus communis]